MSAGSGRRPGGTRGPTTTFQSTPTGTRLTANEVQLVPHHPQFTSSHLTHGEQTRPGRRRDAGHGYSPGAGC